MTKEIKSLNLTDILEDKTELENKVLVPARKALDKAKIKIMTMPNTTFVSTILFSVKIRFSFGVPTAGINTEWMFINPAWFLMLTPGAQVGLLFHETWHVAWNHGIRGMELDHEIYNIAGDHVINLMILAANMELPPEGIHDAKYTGMSTRQVYDILIQEQKDNPDKPCANGPAGGMGGDVIFSNNLSEEEIQKIETELTNTLVKAVTAAKLNNDDPGSIPGEMLRRIDELISPKLPWHVVLQNYMSEHAKNDYSYRRPRRRFFPEFYLPSLYSEGLANISAAMDFSGSMDEAKITAILSELDFIKRTFCPAEMHLLSFDTKIQSKHIVQESTDVLTLEFKGGGGTRISPVIEYFNKIRPTVAILFTDYYVESNYTKPEFPVIWVILENEKANPPTGQVVHYTFD